MPHLPIAIYYEQPHWFKPLFAELDRRGTPFVALSAVDHIWSPEDHPEEQFSLVLNKMSPSAWNRGHGDQIFYTLGYLEHLEARGVRVLNGTAAFRSELSKASQLTLLDGLGLPFPRSRVIHRAEHAPAAARGLRFPVVVKPNIGGSGAGVKRFDTPAQLEIAAAIPSSRQDALTLGMDTTALVQEFIPARDKSIIRVEVLNGKFLYAIRIGITGDTFDLCPADICRTPVGVDLQRSACSIEATEDQAKARLTVEAFTPPADVIADVERIMRAAGIELGGIEYMIDDRDGQRLFYDINALSNFVADGQTVVGFDPFSRLVDWLEAEAAQVSEHAATRAKAQAVTSASR